MSSTFTEVLVSSLLVPFRIFNGKLGILLTIAGMLVCELAGVILGVCRGDALGVYHSVVLEELCEGSWDFIFVTP